MRGKSKSRKKEERKIKQYKLKQKKNNTGRGCYRIILRYSRKRIYWYVGNTSAVILIRQLPDVEHIIAADEDLP